MNRSENCQAYQERDGSHYCGRCHLRWGLNDSKPDCLTDIQIAGKRIADTGYSAEQMVKGLARPQAEQDEINRRGIAGIREVLKE